MPRRDRVAQDAGDGLEPQVAAFSLVLHLNSAGIRPRSADHWTMDTLTTVLTGDAIVGRVRTAGARLRDAEGLPRAVWEPVLDLETWHALRTRLTARRSARAGVRRRTGARLLSGLASRGECGRPLYVRRSGARRRSDRTLAPSPVVYACSARGHAPPCPGSRVSAERLEEFVEETFLSVVGRFEVLRPIAREASAVELLEAETALAETISILGDVSLSPVDLAEVESVPTGETYAEEWCRLDADGRRETLSSALETVAVAKGRRARCDVQGRCFVTRA